MFYNIRYNTNLIKNQIRELFGFSKGIIRCWVVSQAESESFTFLINFLSIVASNVRSRYCFQILPKCISHTSNASPCFNDKIQSSFHCSNTLQDLG